MKLLLLPLNVPGSEQVGQERGARAVFDDVRVFDYLDTVRANEQFLSIVHEYKPDVIWAQLQATDIITTSTLESIRGRVPVMMQWTGDIRETVPEQMSKRAPYFDITYIAMAGQIPMYQRYGRAEYLPIAIDPEEVLEHHDIPKHDIVFIGNHYGTLFPSSSERLDLCQNLSKKFKGFAVYGNGWPNTVNTKGSCDLKKQAAYYRNANICISMNHFNGIEQYYSERLLWCLASGTPTLVRHFPGIEKEFVEYIPFKSTQDAAEKISNLPTVDTERAKQHILANHTWRNRFEKVREDAESCRTR